MDDCLILVASDGYDDVDPVFSGDLKAVVERVAYTAGFTTNAR